MSQSQRWGKVITTMTPVPHGVISTSTGPVDPVEEVVEAIGEELPSEPDSIQED
jgi:hypothetical protein